MKIWLTILALFLYTPTCFAGQATEQASTLQELLERVKHATELEQQSNQARELKFIQQRDLQTYRLDQSKKSLQAQQDRHQTLKESYDNQQTLLTQQQKKLDEKSSNLDALFGIVRQSASETSSLLTASFTHIESPDNAQPAIILANSTELPTITALEAYWHALLNEMVASGKVKTFSAPVISKNGLEEIRNVTRIGLFTLFSNNVLLRYLAESGRLIELPRQPALRYRQLLGNFDDARVDDAGINVATLPLDPTRGALLSLLTQTPTFIEKIHQGGWIGYLILALGAIALLMVIERTVTLFWIGKNISAQSKDLNNPNPKNPLGRLMQTYSDHANYTAEALMLKLEERIRQEAPKLNRGMATLVIIASIAPLLGLLGTVTGMIATFQSITLFGTGDPKLMSGGISQALVTTELGLAVAIPIMLFHTLLAGKSRHLVNLLDKQSAALVAKNISEKSA